MMFLSSEVYQSYAAQARTGRQQPQLFPHQTRAVPSTISAEEIREQLARMLTADLFARSERMSRFLEFIVVETLAGRGEQLNQYAIALAAFDKPTSFDATTDPIVRVEAGRLRAKLREYYAMAGLMDPIQIGMARVGYRPIFLERTPARSDRFANRLAETVG